MEVPTGFQDHPGILPNYLLQTEFDKTDARRTIQSVLSRLTEIAHPPKSHQDKNFVILPSYPLFSTHIHFLCLGVNAYLLLIVDSFWIFMPHPPPNNFTRKGHTTLIIFLTQQPRPQRTMFFTKHTRVKDLSFNTS